LNGDRQKLDELLEQITSGDQGKGQAAAQAIEMLKPADAIEPLISALKNENATVRASAAMALSPYQDALVFIALMEALADSDWIVRHNIAGTMGKNSDSVFVPHLVLALEDEHPWVRLSAVRSLKHIHDKRAVPGLIRVLTDSDETVRHDAAVALGNLKDARAVPELIKRISDTAIYGLAYTGQRVCDAAITALGYIGDESALPRLEKLAKKRTILTRFNIAFALGRIGKEQSIDTLHDLLSDKRTHFLYEGMRICDAAAESLEAIGSEKALSVLDEWQKLQ